MSIQDQYITNRDLSVHLRDARHAHQLFTEHGLAFAPKTKFLYHVVFQPTAEVAATMLSNTSFYQKELGVLAKSVDLPQFRVSLETKQQYNRKKNVQTRVDYQDVTVRFHDDNTGITRALLEEYYRYYYRDGNIRPGSNGFKPRDKYTYSEQIPNYGLNNGKYGPFFDFIKIYQLAKQNWFSYTLINPILSSWSHDQVDSTDGAGLMENTIVVAYEGVLYDNGIIGRASEPAGFTSQETRYDVFPSPLGLTETQPIIETQGPRLLNTEASTAPTNITRAANSASVAAPRNFLQEVAAQPSVLPQSRVPRDAPVQQQPQEIFTSLDARPSGATRDIDTMQRELNANPAARKSFTARVLNTTNELGISYNDYSSASPDDQREIENQALAQISSTVKLQSYAVEALTANRG